MFYKYTKIKTFGSRENEGILTIPGKVVIEEKIDGANFAFFIKNNILHFCSHNQNLTDSDQIEKTGIPKNWKAIEPVLKRWKVYPERFNSDLYYYAESTQKHTILYDNIYGCIGFDVLDLTTMELLPWQQAKYFFDILNLPFANIIEEKDVEEITVRYLKTLYQKSAYRNDSAEGIVIKRYDIKNNYGQPMFAKMVDNKFLEKNKETFGGLNEPRKLNNSDKIAEMYATPGRIEKVIYKLHDEGYIIEMPLMKQLFIRVVDDILEEEIIEIYNQFDSINFKELNKAVSKKCPKILKRVMINV